MLKQVDGTQYLNVRKESSEEIWSLQGFFTVSLLLRISTLIIMINSFLFGVKSVRSVSLIFSLKKPAFFQVFTLIFRHFETGLSKTSGKSGSASPRAVCNYAIQRLGLKTFNQKEINAFKVHSYLIRD